MNQAWGWLAMEPGEGRERTPTGMPRGGFTVLEEVQQLGWTIENGDGLVQVGGGKRPYL